jgi:hypothetical protein
MTMPDGCHTEGSELFLPEELIAYACKWENEYAWRKKDLLHVAGEAEKNGIASGGWQVMFRTPDGNCELCWNSFYPDEMRDNEPWPELVDEGRKAFRLFQDTEVPGLLPRDALWFVLYFKRSAKKIQVPNKDPLYNAPNYIGA